MDNIKPVQPASKGAIIGRIIGWILLIPLTLFGVGVLFIVVVCGGGGILSVLVRMIPNILIFGAIMFALVKLVRHRPKETAPLLTAVTIQQQPLVTYCQQAAQAGLTHDQVVQNLATVGWPIADIEAAYQMVNGTTQMMKPA